MPARAAPLDRIIPHWCANGQPAVAFYLWDEKAGTHLRWSITVLTLRGTKIADLTSFLGPEHFEPFGLPESLP